MVRYIKKIFNSNRGHKLSIRKKIVISFTVVILVMSSLNLLTILKSSRYNKEYNKVVTEIVMANSLNGSIKTQIDSIMWDIVAGKISFNQGNQYEIIEDAKKRLNNMVDKNTLQDKRVKIEVALRTIDTLIKYIDKMGNQIKMGAKVDDNMMVLNDIRSVTSSFQDAIQEFILYELQSCEIINQQLQKNIDDWIATCFIVLLIVGCFSIIAVGFISWSISKPIDELCKSTVSIANGDFDIRIENNKNHEIAVLGESINIMAVKVKELIEKNIKEQEVIKKSELRVLQAQINPHFLYNTLDTIVWTAEAKNTSQVIEIVKALSNFFRISLSDGKDWISINEEIEHIKSYLTIQKIRYRDILNFEISVDEEILKYTMLKLTLQPVVENALYHGIKYKRSKGLIQINGSKVDNKLLFEVVDNGIGIDKSKLKDIIEEFINFDEDKMTDNGFGLKNIQRRIQLYYGEEYGMTIESKVNNGTKVTIAIPIREGE